VPVLLDTSVLIDVLRGRGAAERLRELRDDDAHPPLACAINVEELWSGARPEEEEALRRLVSALRIVPLTDREGERAGAWRRDFAKRGVTLSQADCLIAAAAITVGARLATGNPRHFPMGGLEVEHWPAGE
jgi:predicted nucleic acid-binding protein